MKNHLKHAAILLLTILYAQICWAQDEVEFDQGKCGENVTYTYYGTAGLIMINGEGPMYDYNGSNAPWDDYKKKIKSIGIMEGVTTIGANAFSGCSKVIVIEINKDVEIIKDNAFSGCGKVDNISVYNNNTYDGRDGCRALIHTATNTLVLGCKNSTIPSSVTAIGSKAFDGRGGWTSTLRIPASVQSIGSLAFRNTSNIMLESIPNCDDQAFDNATLCSLSLTDDSHIYTGSNPNMPTCTNVSYTRDIAASSNWGTLVLPFAIASDENVQLYELSAVSGEAMTFSEVDQVAANTPCVFKKKDAAATSLTFAAADVNVTATAAPSANSVDGWTVKGTYEGLTDQTGKYYIAKDGFWKADKGIGIKPFRAWFENAGSQVKAFSIFAQENDMEDSIEALEEMNGGAVEYYDLNGRRMDGLQKGINIIKYGQDKTKKVIIK